MEVRLKQLAERLLACRRKGNRMTLQCVLESAKILAEAKAVAKRSFGKWLRKQGRMDAKTARRHLRVAEFVARNRALMPEIASLGIAKIYALSTLSLRRGRRLLRGEETFSAPLDKLSDLQFKREFRERFPFVQRCPRRLFIYRATFGALVKAEAAVELADRHARKLTPAQRQRITGKIRAIARRVAGWKLVG